jgi:hypothetical protein
MFHQIRSGISDVGGKVRLNFVVLTDRCCQIPRPPEGRPHRMPMGTSRGDRALIKRHRSEESASPSGSVNTACKWSGRPQGTDAERAPVSRHRSCFAWHRDLVHPGPGSTISEGYGEENRSTMNSGAKEARHGHENGKGTLRNP